MQHMPNHHKTQVLSKSLKNQKEAGMHMAPWKESLVREI